MIYYWRSEYLRSYGSGHILVHAQNVEEARKIAREFFEKDFSDRYCFYAKDEEEYSNRKKSFESDIAQEPEIRQSIFIAGSD